MRHRPIHNLSHTHSTLVHALFLVVSQDTIGLPASAFLPPWAGSEALDKEDIKAARWQPAPDARDQQGNGSVRYGNPLCSVM